MRSDFEVFDTHCDTLTVKGLFHTKTQLRLKDIKRYKKYVQVFAICADGNPAFLHAKRHIRKYNTLIKKWGMERIEKREDLKNAQFGALLALEGADALYGSLSALDFFYKEGVRLLTLTWNFNNAAASSITASEDNGLSAFGKKLVRACEKKGIVIDLSHIGDKGFYDVCEISEKPFICSHSNSRTAFDVKRNITDGQFCEIVKRGGVCGINFYSEFLGEKKNIDGIFSHIEHFCALNGEKNIGLGSDFDGIKSMPIDCTGASYMENIAENLLMHNYSEKTVNNILWGNFYRVFDEILK